MSKLTLFIAGYIIISASFMLQVLRFLRSLIGQSGLMILVGLMLILPASAFLIYNIISSIKRRSFNLARTLVVAIALIMVLILAWQIKLFSERIHIAEFVVLGWLATRDLTRIHRKAKAAILACLFCTVAGIIDEAFQWVLPYRFFDLNDIIVNAVGGGWGAVLYLLTHEGKK